MKNTARLILLTALTAVVLFAAIGLTYVPEAAADLAAQVVCDHPLITPLNQYFNVRSGPGTNYDVIGTVERPKAVHTEGLSNGWYRITAADGGGYASASVVTTQCPTATPRPIITETTRPTNTNPPPVTPTQIIGTNTPLPPSVFATIKAQIQIVECWKPTDAPKDSPGVCNSYPIDWTWTRHVEQVQP